LCIDGTDSNSDSSGRYEVSSNGENNDGGNKGYIILGQLGIIGLLLVIGLSFDKTKWKIRTSFFMFALLLGAITLNSVRLLSGSSTTLNSMGNIGLILGIIILLFMFLFLLINFLIELFLYFKKKNLNKWEMGVEA